jgi:hypothetical protein
MASIFRVEEINSAKTSKLATCCLLVFAELISLTLKMEAICSSETLVETQRTTRFHIPEDDTIHNHRCENIKSYILKNMFMCSSRSSEVIINSNEYIKSVSQN